MTGTHHYIQLSIQVKKQLKHTEDDENNMLRIFKKKKLKTDRNLVSSMGKR